MAKAKNLKFILTKEILTELYVNEKMSMTQIAEKLHVKAPVAARVLCRSCGVLPPHRGPSPVLPRL